MTKPEPTATRSSATPAAEAPRLVEALEALELGTAIPEALRAAVGAIEAKLTAAEAVLFSSAIPAIDVAPYTQLEFHSRDFPAGRDYGRAMADLHACALEGGNETLCRLIRSGAVLRRIGQLAAAEAVVLARSAVDVANEAIAAFQHEIARQLMLTKGEIADAALAYMNGRSLAERVAAVKARHEEHAAAETRSLEQARLEVERKAEQEQERVAAEAQEEAVRLATQHATANERARALAAAKLERRLKKTRVKQLEIGTRLFSVEEAARVAGGFSATQVEIYAKALDRAEQERAS